MEGGEIIETAGERVLGRVALQEIKDPFTGEIIVKANEAIDEALAEKIDRSGIERVNIRSVLTCRAKHGVCAMCYGRDLAHGHLVNIGAVSYTHLRAHETGRNLVCRLLL